jgi:metal-responsive CopG/Arc/MetJ family transcriptional regulator
MGMRRNPCIDGASGWEYLGNMKIKTSITLSDKSLEAVDKCGKQQKESRSGFFEVAVWAIIGQLTRHERNVHDSAIINRPAGRETRANAH